MRKCTWWLVPSEDLDHLAQFDQSVYCLSEVALDPWLYNIEPIPRFWKIYMSVTDEA